MRRKMIKTCSRMTHKYTARATAIVLVVVLLALLAIMGTSFVLMSRVENVAAKNQATGVDFDRRMNDVINVIQSTLAEDLWGTPENAIIQDDPTTAAVNEAEVTHNNLTLLGLPTQSNGTTAAPGAGIIVKNEPWDAPTGPGSAAIYYYHNGTAWDSDSINVDGDVWLANNAVGGGNQISNIFNYGAQPTRWTDAIFAAPPLNTFPADADGDGSPQSDSLMIPLPGNPIVGPGIRYYAGVRIVDTCSMVNANTSWCWPLDAGGFDLFSGNILAGTCLYLANFGYTAPLPGKPYQAVAPLHPTLAELRDFQDYYIFRIENPTYGNPGLGATVSAAFVPFDLSDEMELRSRWNINNIDFTSMLENQLNGLSPPLVNPPINPPVDNRTHVTTYSFSRNVRRQNVFDETVADFSQPDARKMFNLNPTVQLLVKRCQFAAGVAGVTIDHQYFVDHPNEALRVQRFVEILRSAFVSDNVATNYADNLADADYHTWQYIVNLIDYLDDDDEPTQLPADAPDLANDLGLPAPALSTYTFSGSNTVYGLEKHAVITEIRFNITGITPDFPNTNQDTYVCDIDVEISNPWTGIIDEPGTVAINIIIPGQGNYNRTANFSLLAAPHTLDGGFTQFKSQNAGQITFVRDRNAAIPLSDLNITAISYDSNNTPEDILIGTITDAALTQGPLPFVSLLKETTSTGRWKSLTSISIEGVSSLGLANNDITAPLPYPPILTANPTFCVYTTTTTDPTQSETWCDPALRIDGLAPIRNLADLLNVPFVGYSTGQRGISQCLLGNPAAAPVFNENKLKFDISDAAPGNKGYEFGQKLLNTFTLINREDDQEDQIKAGQPDTPNEMRLPGLVNVNTAPDTVLQGLHALLSTPLGPAGKVATDIVTERTTNGPFTSIKNLYSRMGGTNYNQDRNIMGIQNNSDIIERVAYLTRFSNLATVRSDTFIAYILIEARDEPTPANPLGNLLCQRRDVVLFDRSYCNQPPLRWNTTTNVWETNPDYVAPKVVARQRVE